MRFNVVYILTSCKNLADNGEEEGSFDASEIVPETP
jgi:hypothetical protein